MSSLLVATLILHHGIYIYNGDSLIGCMFTVLHHLGICFLSLGIFMVSARFIVHCSLFIRKRNLQTVAIRI